MFLNLKQFGEILFRPEESVSLSTVRVGPYLVALVCIPPIVISLGVHNFLVYLFYFISGQGAACL